MSMMLTTNLGCGLRSGQNLEDDASLEFGFESSTFCHLWIPLSGQYAVDRKLSSFWGPLQKDLGAKTVQIYSNAAGKPLDGPEYAPIFETMAEYDLPILLHPARGANFADYAGEAKSKYEIWWTFGWPLQLCSVRTRARDAAWTSSAPIGFSSLRIRLLTLRVEPFTLGRQSK